MIPATDRRTTRTIRYAVGLGVLALALLAASQISCSVMGMCADWFGLPVLGFFETLGILTAAIFSLFALRFLRRKSSSATGPTLAHPTSDADRLSESNEPLPTPRDRWERFCERLSDEEKRRVRDLLREGAGFGSKQTSGQGL